MKPDKTPTEKNKPLPGPEPEGIFEITALSETQRVQAGEVNELKTTKTSLNLASPLNPTLPKPEPATVKDADPDDGPLVKPPTELTAAAS